ncbi:carboxypeptidase-like regulatory domain-containing protein [Niabella beijingensis]|uniref:carboxypeptidase-like regulatory domain-containing protein n=1 Tax=Niabella beijingensis TaxID=2872700 RepID=UPI001CBB9BC0|nr:carboxypeptidase-like regulatory domain-containing protein [Niabella beijingensis]MBZ4190459.1 carboxypeptidase-like regulatory domain-containing protein [Niabella beijingensis]
MWRILFILLTGTTLLPAAAIGQTHLRGNIFLYTNDTPVPGASVTNLTSGKTTVATPAGTYVIEAKNRDLVVFSFTGMTSDTVKVEEQLLKTGYDVGLKEDPRTLRTVTVSSNYQLDSLRRRKEYSDYFEKGPGITGGNRPSDGFGISVSPISHFSKKAKEQRKFRKQLIKNEEEAYIDYVFSPGWVSRLTGLKNDSLQQFMYQYRPSYQLARTLDRPSMTAYINDRYKEFIRRKK